MEILGLSSVLHEREISVAIAKPPAPKKPRNKRGSSKAVTTGTAESGTTGPDEHAVTEGEATDGQATKSKKKKAKVGFLLFGALSVSDLYMYRCSDLLDDCLRKVKMPNLIFPLSTPTPPLPKSPTVSPRSPRLSETESPRMLKTANMPLRAVRPKLELMMKASPNKQQSQRGHLGRRQHWASPQRYAIS